MKANQYNQFPSWFDPMEGFKGNKTVIFRRPSREPDPDNPGKLLLPTKETFDIRDVITIHNSKDGAERQEAVVYLLYSQGERADGSPIIVNDIHFGHDNGGQIELKPSRAKDHAKYKWMKWSNFNGSNPFRDPMAPIRWVEYDPRAEAQAKRESTRSRTDAIVLASSLSDEKVRSIHPQIGKGKTSSLSLDEIRYQVEEYAQENSKEFIALVQSEIVEVVNDLKEAVKLEIITNDNKHHKFAWTNSGEEIIGYTPGKRPSPYESLAMWFVDKPDQLIQLSAFVKAKKQLLEEMAQKSEETE